MSLLKSSRLGLKTEIVDVGDWCPGGSPEQRLFAAVINQAFADATGPKQIQRLRVRDGKKIVKRKTYGLSLDTHQAREWLLGYSADFVRTCDNAGLEPTSVRDFAQKLAADRWARPGKHFRLTSNAAATSFSPAKPPAGIVLAAEHDFLSRPSE